MICHLQAEGPGVIQSESEGLRTRGAHDVNPSPRAGEDERRHHSPNSEASFCLLF